jgi:hypothetical protein
VPLHFEGIKQDLLGNRVRDKPIYVDRDLTRSHQLIQERVVSNSFVFTRYVPIFLLVAVSIGRVTTGSSFFFVQTHYVGLHCKCDLSI